MLKIVWLHELEWDVESIEARYSEKVIIIHRAKGDDREGTDRGDAKAADNREAQAEDKTHSNICASLIQTENKCSSVAYYT